MIPRDYQIEAVEAVFEHIKAGGRSGVVQAATGAGKSICIALIAGAFRKYRVLVLCHNAEVLQSNYETYSGVDKDMYCAGLNKKHLNQRVVFSSRDSFVRLRTPPEFEICIIDEAHLASADEKSNYAKILERVKPKYLLGFTATPYRMDNGNIYGPGKLFEKLLFSIGTQFLIDRGFLCPYVWPEIEKSVDVSKLKKVAGDYKVDDQAALYDEPIVMEAIERWKLFDRKLSLFFCCSVDHAKLVQSLIPGSLLITGETTALDRLKIIEAVKQGEHKVLINVNVMTTGVNIPNIDCIVFMRATQSASLFVQMLGRGLRTSPETGKTDCIAEDSLVLTNHGLIKIQDVTRSMKLWDGVEFVKHDGVIFKGVKNVINYRGLTATEDHLVYTKEGWKTFGRCALEQTPIAITGSGRKTIRETENIFTKCDQKKKSLYRNNLHCLLKNIIERFDKCFNAESWLSGLWATKTSASLVGDEMLSSTGQMSKSEKSKIQRLWRTRNKLRFFWANRNGCLGYRKSWIEEGFANRQNRQQQELRTRESSVFNEATESIAHSTKTTIGNGSVIQNKISKSSICRRNAFSFDLFRNVFRRNRKQILQSKINQTKRGVWDILNAGPRNRFTVENLLVHNCLVLDFAGNYERFGHPDNPMVIRKGKKKDEEAIEEMLDGLLGPVEVVSEAPTKTCDACGLRWPVAKKKCSCGKLFLSHDSEAFNEDNWKPVSDAWISQTVTKRGVPAIVVNYQLSSGKIIREWFMEDQVWQKSKKLERLAQVNAKRIEAVRTKTNEQGYENIKSVKVKSNQPV